MKVAVCVSGAFITKDPKGDLLLNNNILKSKFPNADFYYATWDKHRGEFEKQFPEESARFFPEPLPYYHPYLDIPKDQHISEHYQKTVEWVKNGGKERIEWTSHHTKQILIHAWLANCIKQYYDVIVRTRFDAFVAKNADFTQYLEDTFKNNRANCFGATRPERFDTLIEVDMRAKSLHNHWLIDPIIIHPSNAVDYDHVNELYRNKKLHAAEYGWYQVVSRPHGSRHKNYSGWVNADCRVQEKFKLGYVNEIRR